MRYWVLGLLGAVFFFGSVALFNVKLIELLNTGTCASGNQPFEISRPCPEGTGTDAALLVASIFGIFIGGGLYIGRGEPPPGARPSRFPWPLFAWGFFFGVTGAIVLYHSLTSDVIGPDGELGGIIVGATFLVMGLPALYFVAAVTFRGRGDPTPRGSEDVLSAAMRASRASRPAGGDDRISELERLDRLRQSGALSREEFEREKARVLGR